MGRTVYLLENEQTMVTIEGPSILVAKPFQAPQRIPLRLISQVYIIGKIKLSSDFILVLAANNIPLLIAENSCCERAVTLPFNHKLPKFFKEQRIILENQTNLNKYINWVKAYRCYFQLQTINRFLPRHLRQKNDIGEGDYQIYLKDLLPKKRAFLSPVKKTVRFLIRGLLIENIRKAGLDVHVGAYFRRMNFGFILDLGYLLEAKEDEQVILFFKQKNYRDFFESISDQIKNRVSYQLTKEGKKNIVHRFENIKPKLNDQINKVIDDFFYLIREMQS